MGNDVPIIDIGRFTSGTIGDRHRIAAEIEAACRDIGFLVITGHGVPDRVLHQMHDVSNAFFTLPSGVKRELEVATNDDIGYKSLGNSYLVNTVGAGDGVAQAPDWKESFGARPLAPFPALSMQEKHYFAFDPWPAALPEMRSVYAEYYSNMERVSDDLMRAFAMGLGLEEHYFREKIDRHLSVLGVQHYPAQPTLPQSGQLRAGPHTDFGSLTILHTGHNPRGLQVRYRNNWLDVVPDWDHFVVNIGDLMAQWSNDRWVSTLHRVINPSADRAQLSRQSLTFFHAPNWNAVVECLPNCSAMDSPAKYKPVKAGAYIESKLAKMRDSVAT